MNFRSELKKLYEEHDNFVSDSQLFTFSNECVLKKLSDVPPLYRYSPTDYYNIRSLETDTLFLSEIGKMNDIFEGLNGPTNKWEMGCFSQINDLVYLKSFSENSNNLRMWSEYADNYSGMCIRYIIRDVDYDDNDFLFHLLPVVYSNKRNLSEGFDNVLEALQLVKNELAMGTAVDCTSLKDILHFCLQKSTAWRNEKEWRILVSYLQLKVGHKVADDAENLLLYPGSHNQTISFPFATDVYLGPKTPKYIEEHIVEICKKKERKVHVYRMNLSQTHYRLEKSKLL